MAETSTVVIIAQTIGVAVGTVAAIGIITYGIIKVAQYLTEDPHSHKEKSDDDDDKPDSPIDYDGIKPKTQDTTVRQRNVKKEEDIQNEKNESKSVTKKETSDEPPKKNEKCDTESQTVSEQGTQTGTCDLQEFTLPIYKNHALSDDVSVSSSATSDRTCDSLASTETVIPDVDEDILNAEIPTWDEILNAEIPTWNEMSDADRALCLCRSCEKEVSTVTIPCEHPYLCNECALVLREFYSNCPLCLKHIEGYRTI